MTAVSPAAPATNPAPDAIDPFFELIPDGLWNACIGVQGSEEAYVDGYLEAARELVAAVIDKQMFGSRDSLAMPILYNCRHAIELSLKFVIDHLHVAGMIAQRHKADHDIKSHWAHLRDARVGDARLADLIGQLEPFVVSLAAIDDDGQELRYARNRAGDRSLGGLAVVNLPHIRRSIDRLGGVLDGLKARVVELEDDRLTGAHTAECSRDDLTAIADMVGPHSEWVEPAFLERKAAVMERFGLSSGKFSQALTAIRRSRPLAARVGIETPLRHLADDTAVAVLHAWMKAHPVRTPVQGDLGSSHFKPDVAAMTAFHRTRQAVEAAMTGLLTPETLADMETIYYLGRNREQGEHYDENLDRTLRQSAASGRPMGRLGDLAGKTNLLEGFADGAEAAGRPSLARAVRALRP
ncbi:MAG TPA: hypothetical protein DCG71_05135 [Brevundimonas sp.]|nr:hypothetical protein [Brevundimonas sp.]